MKHKLLRLEALADENGGAWEERARVGEGMRELYRKHGELVSLVYRNLSAWDTVQVARHPKRPGLMDHLGMIAKDSVELHGDGLWGDDKAIVTAFARVGLHKVLVVGHNKGRSLSEKRKCNFGHARPEGHRKALKKMKMAEKFGLPIVCLIDTPGADPGAGSEERGQAKTIASNLMEMSRLRVPIVCVVIGQGGSGGALAIGVGDRLAIMQYAYLSVISPEGCASILFRDAEQSPDAAKALKLTSGELLELGYVDAVIPEPLGGAHRNPVLAARYLKEYLVETLNSLVRIETAELLKRRYASLRDFGSDMVVG
jgi:acetyl-CoA carboxylase carboxyl transferase subunit alpha